MNIQKECNREAFEKYAASRCYYLNKNSDGSYCKANTALAWEIWREASAVPDGFVLVPRDATDEMISHGVNALDRKRTVRSCWNAMVEAAENKENL